MIREKVEWKSELNVSQKKYFHKVKKPFLNGKESKKEIPNVSSTCDEWQQTVTLLLYYTEYDHYKKRGKQLMK